MTNTIRIIAACAALAFAAPAMADSLPPVAPVAAKDPELGGHTLRLAGDGRAVEFSGDITFGVTQELRALLDKNVGIRTITLNSRGGRVQEGRLLADLIRQRAMTTYTESECLSACSLVFLAGAQRYVTKDAKLGFHRGYGAGLTKQDLDDTNDTDRASLIEDGIAPWFADHAYATPGTSMWIPTVDELKSAHVITDVAFPGQFGKPPASNRAVESDIDAQFLAVPVFAAIRKVAPDTYAKIRDTAVDAVNRKKTSVELGAMIAPFVQSLTNTYLPTASDAAIIEFSKVTVLDLQEIAAKSPEACYTFAYRPAGVPPINAFEYLSPEVLLRGQRAMAMVIESKMTPPPIAPTDKDINWSRNYVMEQLIQKFGGGDVEAYANARTAVSDRAKVCRMTIAFYNEVFTLPPDEQARLLRFMLARHYLGG